MPITGSDPALTVARLGILRLGAGRLGAIFSAPAIPGAPSPADGGTGAPVLLTWSAPGATSYDVYFGTSPTPPLVSSAQAGASYVPTIADGITYFWKIVAINGIGTTAGPVWSFTAAAPAVPHTPNPTDDAIGLALAPVLTWVAADATSYDVYFGTNPSPPLVAGGVVGASYSPSGLTVATSYYWRIVARNAAGTTTGPVWSFYTVNPTALVMTIAGVTPHMRVAGLSIRDQLNDAPNTCSFTVDTTEPVVDQDVQIGLGGLTTPELLFAGTIQSVERIYQGAPANVAWLVQCTDYTALFNRKKVRTRYAQQSATAIALDLVAGAPGFTTTGITAGLPVVTGGIDFTDEDRMTCLRRLATRIGGYPGLDYGKDVKLFLEDASDAPDPIDADHPPLDDPPIRQREDVSQRRTRVYVEGGGSQARNAVAVGATSLPVTDASWYSGTGGIVVSGPQRITYTGKGAVGGPAAPTVAADVTVIGVVGAGPYTYKVSQINAGVETPLSPASAAVSLPPVADPTSAITAATGSFTAPGSGPAAGTPTAGGAVTPGAHTYAVTFVTATGETTPSPSSGSVSPSAGVPQITAPTPAPSHANATGFGGTTLYSPGASVLVVVTYLGGAGETTAGGASNTVVAVADAGGAARTHVTGIPVPSDGNVTGKRLYISVNGAWIGCVSLAASDTAHFVGSIGPTAGSPPGSNTTSIAATQTVPLTAIPIGPGGTTARKIYRTAAGGSQLKLLTTISNNTATTSTDTAADAALGTNAPTVNTAGGALGAGVYLYKVTFQTGWGETATNTGQNVTVSSGSANLSAIPVSSDARVTARKIYRTEVNGSVYRYEQSILNNSSTTATSSIADAALGPALIEGNTSAGGGKINVSAIPIGGAGVTARKLFRTIAGGTSYKLLATIPDNTTTTFVDNVRDSDLGAVAAGDVASELTGIPASGPGAILYDITIGAEVNLVEQCDDLDAQADLAALEGGVSDGVIEHTIQDRRVSSAEARAMGMADLALFSRPIKTVPYATRDTKTKSGKTAHVDLFDILGDFVIQSVTIDQIDVAPNLNPRYTVEASSVRFSFEDVLRQLQL